MPSGDNGRSLTGAAPQARHGVPLQQHNLQGVALRRTRRVDGVRVAGSPLLGAVLALRTATLPSAAAAARSRPVRRLLGVPDRGNGVSTSRCASGSERRRSRTRRGAGVVEALEPCPGVAPALRSRRAAYGEVRR